MSTLRDDIMDKYWSEFLVSKMFSEASTRYEYAIPLEAAFWRWFKENHLTNEKPKSLEEYR